METQTWPGPVIVLTYAHAGADDLMKALSVSQSLTCTLGTGLLPLCDSAAATWQKVESRNAAPSTLALKSIRALVTTMRATVQSRTGASRWCEIAFTAPETAEMFLRIFPDATFLCLHRSLRGVLAEGTAAYPWGLGSSPFWPYSGGHPGNNAATIAAYWAACTRSLLEFQAAHQDACLRVRCEDLAADPYHQVGEIFARLGLDRRDLVASAGRPDPGLTGPGDPVPAAPLPLDRLPPKLLAEVHDLHAMLDYVP